MDIVLLSSYHGGSHRAWAEGIRRFSRHNIRVLALPDRFWKWRMHGGAVTLARQFLASNGSPPHLILATDMVDLTSFLALTRQRTRNCPAVLYMHENQLTYPLPDKFDSGPMRRQKGERDLHYSFINYVSMLVADRVLFNSNYHRLTLMVELERFLRHFPDHNELESAGEISRKSYELPVGIDLKRFDVYRPKAAKEGPPLILWNHRWEYDKNPALFFKALSNLKEMGFPFQVAICGRNYRRSPDEFKRARIELADRIVHWGFADDETYARLLWQAAVVVSTAIHEFFGISVLEATYCQTMPIVPDQLSYPEIIPEELHEDCQYDSTAGLHQRLVIALTNDAKRTQIAKVAASFAARYDWRVIGPAYDRHFEEVA